MAVQLHQDGGVAEIVLARPDKMNAFDEAMGSELLERLAEVRSSGARALVVRGEGRGFSAGRDLDGMDPTQDASIWLRAHVDPVLLGIADLPIPTFAAVHGPALGVGFGIAFACDVIVAAENAKLGSPFANIGAVLDSGGHHVLVHRIGAQRALDLIYSARLISGTEAAAIGLVTAAVPADELLDDVRSRAARAAEGPTAAFALSKSIVRRIAEEGIGYSEVLRAEADAQGAASRTEDYREGMTAFVEKRSPTFHGR